MFVYVCGAHCLVSLQWSQKTRARNSVRRTSSVSGSRASSSPPTFVSASPGTKTVTSAARVSSD